MVTFLFWNLFRKPLAERVVRLARLHDVDFVMLAEAVEAASEIEGLLRSQADTNFRLSLSNGGKTLVYSKLTDPRIREVFNDPFGGLTIRQIEIGPPPGILLAVVHFPSRVNWDRDDQTLQASRLVADLTDAEDRIGHRCSILVGDLNMNPFDAGVTGAKTLHAVMTRKLARREERVVQGRPYRLFYNPMWSFFGDRTSGPPGTYYHRASTPGNLYWNIYDQVLLRPSLMDSLDHLQILTTDGQADLVTKAGLPDRAACSDHLPILFRLNL